MASGEGAKGKALLKQAMKTVGGGQGPLSGSTPMKKFAQLTKKKHADQAKWFINAFWKAQPVALGMAPDLQEHIFQACKLIEKLDPNGSNGCEIDQLPSHRFLEQIDGAITWTDFKKTWKKFDIDFNGKLSLAEYFLNKFDLADRQHIKQLVEAPQAVIEGLAQAEADLEAVRTAHAAQVKAKKEALRIAKQIQEFKERFNLISARFQKIIDDDSLGIVKRNKAKAELGQHLSGSRARKKNLPELDPDSLHVMEIDQGAAVRKQKKATRQIAKRMEKAQAEVERIQNSGTAGEGMAWWLGRELQEMEKYMSKKAYAKLKAKLAKKQSAMQAGK